MPARFGMFLKHPYHFDAAVFATAESEAVVLDPQQRLLLESTFEVYSRHQGRAAAAPAPGKSPVGVFVGISTPDYADLGKAHSSIGVYTVTGSALSVAAGRLSYFFGFAGPAVSGTSFVHHCCILIWSVHRQCRLCHTNCEAENLSCIQERLLHSQSKSCTCLHIMSQLPHHVLCIYSNVSSPYQSHQLTPTRHTPTACLQWTPPVLLRWWEPTWPASASETGPALPQPQQVSIGHPCMTVNVWVRVP